VTRRRKTSWTSKSGHGWKHARTTRAATVSGENASHTHWRWVRFPRLDFRKYSGVLLIKAEQEERESVLRQGQGGHDEPQYGETGGPHTAAESILRGWAQYHHPVVAKETFSKLDSLLWWRLTRWARRRHPNKSPRWVAKKCWSPLKGGRNSQSGFRTTTRRDGRGCIRYRDRAPSEGQRGLQPLRSKVGSVRRKPGREASAEEHGVSQAMGVAVSVPARTALCAATSSRTTPDGTTIT
jgi:hypothetical protein